MSLTISILNYNGGEILNECVEAVLAHRLPKDTSLQIIDNGSTDGSADKTFEKYPVHCLFQTDNADGFITGVNESFKRAKHEIVFFLSYDVILDKPSQNTESIFSSVLRNFFQAGAYEKPITKSIVQPVIYTMEGKIQNAGQRLIWPGYGSTLKTISHEIEIFTTTAFLMTKSAFKEIGPFDEDLAPAYYENVDYSLRAKKKGYNFFVTPFITAKHYTSLAFSKKYSGKQIRNYYKVNRRKVIQKHYQGWDRFFRLMVLDLLDFTHASRLLHTL